MLQQSEQITSAGRALNPVAAGSGAADCFRSAQGEESYAASWKQLPRRALGEADRNRKPDQAAGRSTGGGARENAERGSAGHIFGEVDAREQWPKPASQDSIASGRGKDLTRKLTELSGSELAEVEHAEQERNEVYQAQRNRTFGERPF